MFESFIYFVINDMYVCNINVCSGVVNSTTLSQFKLWFTETEADTIEQYLQASKIAYRRVEDKKKVQEIENAFNNRTMMISDIRKVYKEYKMIGGGLGYGIPFEIS